MRGCYRLIVVALRVASSGCITLGKSDESTHSTLNLDWLVGGLGMAVDGDDRDDYARWFDDDDCECRDD